MDGSQEVIHLNYLVTLKIHHSQPIFKPKPKPKPKLNTQIKNETEAQTQIPKSKLNTQIKNETQAQTQIPKPKLLNGLGVSLGLVHAYLRLMEKDQTPREFNHNFKSSFAFRQLT